MALFARATVVNIKGLRFLEFEVITITKFLALIITVSRVLILIETPLDISHISVF